MIEQKDKQVLAELMQYGYDRNVIAIVNMRGNDELEKQFEELTRTVIKSCRDWYNSTDEFFEEETKRRTVMRFCFTVGIGAAWFWENKKDDITSKGLFECMSEPRTAFEMDEYIEDMTGIWWSSKSIDHQKYRRILSDCLGIIRQYYDLTDQEQEQTAGHVLMLFGMYCGYTRIYHDRTIESYEGEMPWHWDVWNALYGKGEDQRLDEYDEWARKAFYEGKIGLGEYVIRKNPDSEFGMTDIFYRPFTYNDKAGIRVLAYSDDEDIRLLTATPVFDSHRNYLLVIDKVYVWESGAEATIKAHFYDDEDSYITFYDTNYLENKDRYFAGLEYMFDLYAIAYNAKVVPEDQRSFTFEGEEAVSFKKKLGEEPDYDENGNPEPIVFQTGNLHMFTQTNDKIPEDASFRAPIKAVYDDVDYLGKNVYEIEIGIPNHSSDHNEKKHPLTVYIAAGHVDNRPSRSLVNEPIQGVLYLQGKMRSMVNMAETPSIVLHTFEATKEDGSPSVFKHICTVSEEGQIMNEEERHEFAKEVYCLKLADQMWIEKIDSEDKDMPDFKTTRRRGIWVKADVGYTAEKDFIAEQKYNYLWYHYRLNRIPVIAYISLYDMEGNECQWLKGGNYTAKIRYGSVLPGQKMDIMTHKNHDELVQVLFNSIQHLDTRVLSLYLHKDLDFRSDNLPDPIITRDEYIARTEQTNNSNRKAKEGPVQPVLHHSEEGGDYIELVYPDGVVDILTAETKAGFITSIRIKNLKTGKSK